LERYGKQLIGKTPGFMRAWNSVLRKELRTEEVVEGAFR